MSSIPRVCGRLSGGMALCAILISRLLADPALGQCHYTYQVIVAPPGGEFITPMAINNLGHVTGYMEYNGADRGFLWTPGRGTQLLPWPAGVIRMQATGINDLDHICGWVDDWAAQEVKAFLWDGSDFTFIRTPYPSGRIEARDVNNHDQVVGRINAPGGLRAFFWENGVLTEVDSLIGAPQPRMVAINDDGVMTGFAGAGSVTHAWVLDQDGVHWLAEDGLAITATTALSNAGVVVGWGVDDPTGEIRGCIWDGPTLHVMVPPPEFDFAVCRGVNNAGRVVGEYQSTALRRGFIWQAGSAYPFGQFVSGLGAVLPVGINDHGQILTRCILGTVVLTPVWKPGDLTGDCAVWLDDLLLVLSNFGAAGDSPPRGDVDLNGVVNLADLAALLNNWGR